MKVRGADAAGFSLVEVIIAMFILGIIAVALLPVLWQGIRFSVEQSDVATATRELNGLVEHARDNPSCNAKNPDNTAAFPDEDGVPYTYTDPRGGTVTVDAQAGYLCAPGVINHVTLTAVDSAGDVVATVTAKILMGS